MSRRNKAAIAATAAIGAAGLAFAGAGSSAPRSATITLTGSGTVQAGDQLDVNFATSGRLAQVNVKPGDQVHAGEVLARLDSQPAESSLRSAEAALASARAQLAALKAPPSRVSRNENKAAALHDQATVDAAREALSDARAGAADDLAAVELAVAHYQARRRFFAAGVARSWNPYRCPAARS